MPNTEFQTEPNSFSGFTYTNNSGKDDAIVYLQLTRTFPIAEARSFIAVKPTVELVSPNPAIVVADGASVTVSPENLIMPFWYHNPAAEPVYNDYHPDLPTEGVTAFAIWVWNATLGLAQVWSWAEVIPGNGLTSIAATHTADDHKMADMTFSAHEQGEVGPFQTPVYEHIVPSLGTPGCVMPEYGAGMAGTVGNPNPNPPLPPQPPHG